MAPDAQHLNDISSFWIFGVNSTIIFRYLPPISFILADGKPYSAFQQIS